MTDPKYIKPSDTPDLGAIVETSDDRTAHWELRRERRTLEMVPTLICDDCGEEIIGTACDCEI